MSNLQKLVETQIGWLTPSNVLPLFDITEHKAIDCLVFSRSARPNNVIPSKIVWAFMSPGAGLISMGGAFEQISIDNV